MDVRVCQSILDYIMVKEKDEEALNSMMIDEEKKYAPGGINDENETAYSDHNTIFCEFNWLFEDERPKSKNKILTKKSIQKNS